MESSAPQILTSDSLFHLLYSVASMVPGFFPRISISRVVSLFYFIIVSTSTTRSWITLFNSCTCLPVFSCIPFSELLICSLKDSIFSMRLYFGKDSWFQVCCCIQGLLCWESWVLVMPTCFGFCCLWSCAFHSPGVCWSGWLYGVCLFCPWVASGLLVGL